ncbi:MalY/PatB family protein [Vagococcus fluvialis]|uniref:MalY/PatB family protein n=1 Tax=Vagococcus fluvialis TaxID=2738 RepID=UPI003B5A9A18
MTVKSFVDTYYVERKGTASVKWDGLLNKFEKDDLLPLWVADMDFKVPEVIQEKLMERINHGVFGYSFVEDSYYEAFLTWQKERHDIYLEKEWVRFTTGVVNSFNYIIQSMTEEKDSVLILSPVYYPFFDAVNNNNRQLVESKLVNIEGHYGVDFDDFEAKIIDNHVKIFLHCSPQNPVGRVWTQEELTQLFEICNRHGVQVISDEIHQDFIQPGKKFISALSLDEKFHSNLFVLTAPSKTFNLASLLHSHVIIPNEEKRQLFDSYLDKGIGSTTSLMGMIATEAAYRGGEEWLNELIEVIEFNFVLMKSKFAELLPEAVVTNKEATYLSWIDLSAYIEPQEMQDMMENKAKIAIDYGEWFDQDSGSFIRINLATSPENIERAISQIASTINNK